MGEANELYFSYKEIVEALIKIQGLHEGLWGVSVELGLGALNIKGDPDGKTLVPAGLVGIQRIGIRRYDTPSNLTVDAAEANPAPKAAKKGAGKKGAK